MSSERAVADLGSKLRQAREHRGLSLLQVASATKISVGVLEALERNDFSRLPAGVFSRAFVRAYAAEVGLDPDAAIHQYAAQCLHESFATGRPPSERLEDNDSFESDRQIASTFVRLIAFSAPVAVLIVYLGAGGLRPESRSAGGAASSTRGAADAPARAPGVESGAVASRGADADSIDAGRVVVGLHATRACRVLMKIDGGEEVERRFEAGERQTVEILRDLVLTADDGGAIVMTLNGAEARPLGREGQSVTARLNSDNLKDYLLTR